MDPTGGNKRTTRDSYGTFTESNSTKLEQPPTSRVGRVSPHALAVVHRNLFQLIDGVKSRLSDYKLKNALDKFMWDVVHTLDKKATDLQLATLKEELNWIENLFSGDTSQLENLVSIYLADLHPEYYELLVKNLSESSSNIESGEDKFLSRISTILKDKLTGQMDDHALHVLDGLAESLRTFDRLAILVEKNPSVLKLVAHEPKVYSPLMLRSLILKRYPKIAFEGEQVTYSRINIWIEGQSMKMRERINLLIGTIADPDIKGSTTEEIQLHAFAQLVMNARRSVNE